MARLEAETRPDAVWRRMWVGVACIVLPACVLAFLAGSQLFTVLPQLERSQDEVDHTFQVISAAQALGTAVRDAERGQRGFIITGDPSYLDSYHAGIARAPGLIAQLEQLTADNAEQRRRIELVGKSIDEKMTELDRTIEARQRDGFDAARRIVETNVGRDAMRKIDDDIAAFVSAESTLLEQRRAKVSRDERQSADIALISAIVALVAVLLGVFVLVGSLRDLRAAERARRGTADQLRRLIDGATDYAIYMLDADGRIRTWNLGAERIKGYRADEIIGQHFSVFYPEEDRQAGVPQSVLETATRDGRWEAEAWRVRKDGSRFWANVVVDAVRDQAGRLIGFAKITRDISERRLAQQNLEEAHARLAQAQKMEALGQLTGGVAHDFNNMLHVVLGSVGTVKRRLQSADPDLLRQLDIVQETAQRAATLTRQLLAFARRQPLRPQALDPNKLVAGMSDLLLRTIREEIAIETVLAGGVWRVSADANQLENAILNLAINARDAMPGGGKLTIETANTYLDAAYAQEHTEVTAGQYVMIAVTDTGVGMARETIDQAFDPFFTTKEAGAGTGLGLSQVFGFVKQSGGHVKIYSELGEGTTVKIYLPRHAAETAASPAAEPPAELPARAPAQMVLVVEDDESARNYCIAALRELGYAVQAAPHGAAALRLLDDDPSIALLFTDVGLPGGMNGRQLADEALRRRPGLKILFTTAYARNAIVHQGRLDPGVELLVKPFTYEDLAANIRRMLERDAAPGVSG